MALFPVMMFDLIGQLGQGILDGLNEIRTTRSHAAETDHGIALGEIISHRQNFSVRPEPMRRALDHIVSGLSAAGKQDFDARGRSCGRWAIDRPGPIEENSYGSTCSILVAGQPVNEL